MRSRMARRPDPVDRPRRTKIQALDLRAGGIALSGLDPRTMTPRLDLSDTHDGSISIVLDAGSIAQIQVAIDRAKALLQQRD